MILLFHSCFGPVGNWIFDLKIDSSPFENNAFLSVYLKFKNTAVSNVYLFFSFCQKIHLQIARQR